MLWWIEKLSTPIFSPIPGPADLINVGAYSDASSGHGIGLCICGYWRVYRLLPGWRGPQNERDIGWAEAVGYLLLVIIVADRATKHKHYKFWGDNIGVVEGWWSGRSRNRSTNGIFKSIHKIITDSGFHVHTRYIPRAENPADPFSRGHTGPECYLLPRITIPGNLQPFIVDYNYPFSSAELTERDHRKILDAAPRTSRESRQSYDQWQLEEEGRLLSAFQHAW